MISWPMVPLSDLLRRSDESAVLEQDASYHEVTIRLWGKGVVSRGKVRGSDVAMQRRFVRTGQLIMSKIDARNGALGFVPPELDGAIVSNDFPSFEVKDEAKCLPDFLAAMVKSAWFVDLCKASSEGTTNRVRLKEERFLNQKVPLPPLPEQRAIVAKLDELRDKTIQISAHLDAIDADADALVLSLHNELSGGRTAALSDVIELHEKSVAIESVKSYPQVGVRGFGGGLFAKPAITGSETTYRSFNCLYEDAFVLSQVKGWEGAIALTPPELVGMYASPEYRTFRCLPGRASPQYLVEIIRRPWFWSLLQDATRGVGARRERTRPEQFLNVILTMPEYDRQLEGAQIFTHLAALRAKHAAIRQSNTALLPATLERIFGGHRASDVSPTEVPVLAPCDFSLSCNLP